MLYNIILPWLAFDVLFFLFSVTSLFYMGISYNHPVNICSLDYHKKIKKFFKVLPKVLIMYFSKNMLMYLPIICELQI